MLKIISVYTDSPSTSKSNQNGNIQSVAPPPVRIRPKITPRHVKLPPPKPLSSAPDIPPPVAPRTNFTPDFNRDLSEDAEYIEVCPDPNLKADETQSKTFQSPENVFAKVQNKTNFNDLNQPNSKEPEKKRPELDLHEDGNWNLVLKPKNPTEFEETSTINQRKAEEPFRLQLQGFENEETGDVNSGEEDETATERNHQEPYRIQLRDFEDAETDDVISENEEEVVTPIKPPSYERKKMQLLDFARTQINNDFDSEEEEQQIPSPVKTLSVGGSNLSSQAASIFFGSSDDRPQPMPRKVNFFGRNSISSNGSEASA